MYSAASGKIGRDVTGVDQMQGPGPEVDSPDEAGDKVVLPAAEAVLEHRAACAVSLLGQGLPRASGTTQRTHAQGCGQRRPDSVPHRVGDGEVQGVAADAVVEGVP